jgi:signal transduction histidine kinase
MEAARKLLEDALLLQKAGFFSLVLESIPSRLATLISERLDIPTIGIGAGAGCDGQVLVSYDLLGLFDRFTPKFVKKYANLYEIMQDDKNRVKEEKQAIQEMISDIAHQVKTPVANLKMYNTTLLERQLPPEKQQEFHTLMGTQIDKLDFLMQAMVKMSRLETGTITLSVSPTQIYDTVGLALVSIELPAEKKKIEVTINCDPSLVVPHDKKWTAEALFNILDNAVKYTPSGGKISVAVERWEIATKIDITDTGRGIPEQHLAHIFKRFYREGENIRLQPSNASMQPIIVPAASVEVQGRVIGVLRKY